MREYSDENLNISKINGQLSIDIAQVAAQFLTSSYIPSEIITIETETITMETSKIALDMNYNQYCSLGGSVALSNEYIVQQSYNGTQFMDCIVMNTQKNIYFVSNATVTAYVDSLQYETTAGNLFQSDFILMNVIAQNETFTTPTATVGKSQSFLVERDPILLSFLITDVLFFEHSYLPQCSFYNQTTGKFEHNGSYLLSYDSLYFKCSCYNYHAKYFGVTWEYLTLEVNYSSNIKWKALTFDNVINNPFGLIVGLSWVVICILTTMMLWAFNKRDNIKDTPLIMQPMQIAMNGDNPQNISKYRSIQQIRMISNDDWTTLSFCCKFKRVFKMNIMDNHIILGICCRRFGTGCTNSQRMAILLVRVSTSMAMVAMFYGVATNESIGDLSLS